LALDGEVDAFAEARAVNSRLAHVEGCGFYTGLVEMLHVGGKGTAMESIDQDLLGVCLGPGLRPWRGDGSVSNHCWLDVLPSDVIDLDQSTTMQKPYRCAIGGSQ